LVRDTRNGFGYRSGVGEGAMKIILFLKQFILELTPFRHFHQFMQANSVGYLPMIVWFVSFMFFISWWLF